MLLEFSQYLENYLWRNYTPSASSAHVLSMVSCTHLRHALRRTLSP